MVNRSEYTANLALADIIHLTEMDKQVIRNNAVRIEVNRIRKEIAERKANQKKWWRIWK